MFNMSGFEPTVESEENFKRCSNFMKNIHFGYVDVQNLHEEIHDVTGKQSKKLILTIFINRKGLN